MANSILVINSGSSTLKVSLFENLERVFDERFTYTSEQELKDCIEKLSSKLTPGAIGHRFVHGLGRYSAPTLLDKTVMADLEKSKDLDPLHSEPALLCIKAAMHYFGDKIPEYAVFDTAFHSQMPFVAANYAIPREYGVKRYGFHGISHAYLWERFVEHTGQAQAKVITLHLGNGCSMCAINDGRSMDTSMGFTPAEGLVMATRAGDVDAAILPYLSDRLESSSSQVMDLLNYKSGLLGISGISPNMKELLTSTHQHAKEAVDLFCYRALKYLGAYIAALEGVDAIIFSGGIGENAPQIREKIIAKMQWYGLAVADDLNQKAANLSPGTIYKISKVTSSIPIFVIGTDENAYIARVTAKAFLGQY